MGKSDFQPWSHTPRPGGRLMVDPKQRPLAAQTLEYTLEGSGVLLLDATRRLGNLPNVFRLCSYQ